MRNYSRIASLLGCLLTAASSLRAADRALAPVTVEQVRRVLAVELRSRGFADNELPEPDDVEVPLPVPMRVGSNLRVSSVCWDADAGRIRMRLECDRSGCLPFLIYVHSPSHAQAAQCQLIPHPGYSTTSEPGVRAGEPATAVIVASGVRVTAAVTCLERGARGEIIRVRGGQGRIFRARVTGPRMVETLAQ